jgi:SET domain-containing protein
MTKKQSTYEKSVKPFYHISKEFHHGSNKCNIIYSPDRILSSKSQFSIAEAKQMKNKFGFKLLCDDLSKSVKEAESFRFKQDITHSFPKNLIEKGIKSYGVETNTRDLFVVHKISAKIGFAISTYSALKEGMIVAEYVGERKPSDIKISDTTYLVLNDDGTKIDAKDYGNVARFFHHCPSDHTDKQVMTANIAILPWQVSETLTKIFFITIRDIKEFEPLCWDYNDKYAFDHEVELLNAETYLPITESHNEL